MSLLLLFGGAGSVPDYTGVVDWTVDEVLTWTVLEDGTWAVDEIETWTVPGITEAHVAKSREILQGLQIWGEDDNYAPKLDVTNITGATSPTSPSAKIFTKNSDGTFTDVTSTKMTGACSVSGTVITLPAIHSLTSGTRYRVEVKFTFGGGVYERWAEIRCER